MSEGQDIAVLREMVRLAENRRNEEFEHIERVNRYNLALIAFAGSFLSLLVTVKLAVVIVQIAGAFLLLSIVFSLLAIMPRKMKGGTLVVEDDVKIIRSGHTLDLQEYLLSTAELTDRAAANAAIFSKIKKWLTLFSVFFLAISLATAYYLHAYA